MAYTGRAPSQAPITSADINDGVVTPADLSTGAPSWDASGNVTVGGNVVLGDNDKAIFGAGSDLQIYHDSSHSYVKDAGTGYLYLQGAGQVRITNDVGTQMVTGISNGAVELYNNGNKKLSTTSTGIDVTGTVTADGLTVDGDVQLGVENITNGVINVPESMFINFDSNNDDTTEKFIIASNGTGSSGIKHLQVEESGDISFYEDTGTTAKFFWDASAERLGIGTSSPLTKVDIITSSTGGLHIEDGAKHSAAGANITSYQGSTNTNVRTLGIDAQEFIVRTGVPTGTSTTERMRIDSSGRVGIGTTLAGNSANKLTIRKDSATNIVDTLLLNNGSADNQTGTGVRINMSGVSEANSDIRYAYIESATLSTGNNHYLAFGTNTNGSAPTERMRIDSSGNLLVGKTSSGTQNTADGFELRQAGYLFVTKSSDTVAYFNRRTTDGSIVDFRKDGTTVGSIGTSATGNIFTAGGNSLTYPCGLRFNGSSSQTGRSITPTDDDGGLVDGFITLGANTARYKDLYLSGGVYLGGTGAANYLDDYEEGTVANNYIFTNTGNLGTSGALGTNYIKYVKIGKVVHVHGQLGWTNNHGNTGASARFSLPYAVDSQMRGGLAFGLVTDINFAGGTGQDFLTIVPEIGSAYAYFLHANDSSGHTHLSGAFFTSNSYRTITFSGSYLTS